MAASYDNRETCTNQVTSSCVPFTGYVNTAITAVLPCRPNVNDVLKAIQDIIDAIKLKLGDNTTLVVDEDCTTLDVDTATQKDINQKLFDELCALKATVATLGGAIDPTTIMLAVDLLCLQDEACEPASSYNLLVVINKLLVAYCNHETRLAAIESILNI